MTQTELLQEPYRNRLWFKTLGYILAFAISASIAYYVLFHLIPLPTFIKCLIGLIPGWIGLLSLRNIFRHIQDVISDKQLIINGLVQKKWSKADYGSSESNRSVPDTFNLDILENSTNLLLTKAIDAKDYHKILEGDEVKIIYLEHINQVLDVSIIKTTQIRNFTPNSVQNDGKQILQTLHTEPLTNDELVLAKEGIGMYRLGAFLFSVIAITLSVMLWHKQKTVDMSTFSFNKELFLCVIAACIAIASFFQYLKRNRDFRNAYKNVLIGRVHNKYSIAEEALDSFKLIIKSDAIDGELNFNIRQQTDFDKILVNDIVKIYYLERTKLVFRVEFLQSAQH